MILEIYVLCMYDCMSVCKFIYLFPRSSETILQILSNEVSYMKHIDVPRVIGYSML